MFRLANKLTASGVNFHPKLQPTVSCLPSNLFALILRVLKIGAGRRGCYILIEFTVEGNIVQRMGTLTLSWINSYSRP